VETLEVSHQPAHASHLTFTDAMTVYDQGERISKAIGARAYYECSSLLNQGVDDIFEAATRAAMLVRESGHGPSNPAHPRKDTPGGKQSTDEKHGKNCCLIN
jgi:Rho family protein